MTTGVFALWFIGVAFFVLVLLFAGIALLSTLFARAGGWARLAERYGADQKPEGQKLTWQTLEVGGLVRYRWTVVVVISPRGLYLALSSPFIIKHPPMLIPWTEIKEARRAILFWRRAARLTIGDPPVSTIAMWMSLFEAIRPYLPPGAAKDV